MNEGAMAETDKHGDQDGGRIAKVIARAGLASRREAEDWIAAGRVAVNGAVIHSPALNVSGRDRISIDGEPLPARERTRVFLYHKPRGVLTSHSDPRGRSTIFQNLPKGLPRLISVGRLDINTEGLLLVTNDGGLARALELLPCADISALSLDLGFSSHSHFTASFRRAYGRTPQQFSKGMGS